MPGILAIDQATVTGWAFAEPGCEPMWGHVRLNKREKATAGEVGAEFYSLVNRLILRYCPLYICFETPYVPRPRRTRKGEVETEGGIPLNAQTMRKLLGLAFLIDTIAAQRGIECREVLSTAATKAMTGRGKYPSRQAKKLATMQACWARGWKASEDEADALAILIFSEARLYPEAFRSRQMVLKMPRGPLFEERTVA